MKVLNFIKCVAYDGDCSYKIKPAHDSLTAYTNQDIPIHNGSNLR